MKGSDFVFKVEYLRNGWVKKDGVRANVVLCDWPNFRYPIDFAFSPRLSPAAFLHRKIVIRLHIYLPSFLDQETAKGSSSSQAATCLPRMMEASHHYFQC